MKRFLITLALFFSPTLASATGLSNFQIGGTYSHVNLKPHVNHSFDGDLGGLIASYAFQSENCFYLGARATWKEGDTSGASGKRTLMYIDAQEQLGYTFTFCPASLTLFTGFGYRHLRQKLTTKTHHSLLFKYNEFYVPVGLLLNYTWNTSFALNLNLTWMPQIFPTLSLHPLGGAKWNLTRELGNYMIELPLIFTPWENKCIQLILTPFYERWNNGHSTARLSSGIPLGVPKTTYDFFGANLTLALRF